MGTRALDMSIGPLGHQWLQIMLNIHHDEWIGGVLIRRQATGPMMTPGRILRGMVARQRATGSGQDTSPGSGS